MISSWLLLTLFAGVAFGDNCVISNYDEVVNAAKTCTNLVIKSMQVPAGVTLEIDLQDGASLEFQGTTTFGVANWEGPLLRIRGSGIKVTASDDGWLDGQGPKYWDGLGGAGSKKPLFFKIQSVVNLSEFRNIKVKNCPERCVSIGGSDHLTLDGWTVDVSEGDINKLGHNTDGFDISSSTYILIQNTNVYNQDDCIAINQGSHMTFYKMYCSGGHGLSISVGLSKEDGNPNTISDINFLDCTVVNSANGIHIKTHNDGGKGLLSDVTYDNIKLSGITNYGIEIHENYPSGDPKNNVPITNLVLSNFEGSVGSKATGIYILCADGGCSDWHFSNINISGGKGNSCNYTPSDFKC